MTWFDPRVYGFIFYHHDRNLLKSWLFQIHAYNVHVPCIFMTSMITGVVLQN